MRLLALAVALAGCGGSQQKIQPEYTGCGSDEQWMTFDAQEPSNTTVGDSTAPQLTQPDVSGTVAFSPKPVFRWNQDANDPGKPDGDVQYIDGPGCMACCPEFTTGALTTLHLPAISGNEYDLQFFQGSTMIHRTITTLQEWTPTDDVWSSWKGSTITLKLYRMDVLRNSDLPPPNGGPFLSMNPYTIHVGS